MSIIRDRSGDYYHKNGFGNRVCNSLYGAAAAYKYVYFNGSLECDLSTPESEVSGS